MTTRVTGVRIDTGAREELNEFTEQAWRDGTTVETFTDIREEQPPTDASPEARALGAKAAFEVAHGPITASTAVLLAAWVAVVRAVDASRPSALLPPPAVEALANAPASMHDGDLAKQWPWCLKCDKRVDFIQRGESNAELVATCHGETERRTYGTAERGLRTTFFGPAKLDSSIPGLVCAVCDAPILRGEITRAARGLRRTAAA